MLHTAHSYKFVSWTGQLSKTIKRDRHTPTVQPTRCTCYLKLFILVKRCTCFGRSFRPSSGAQNCVYSNGICQTAAATCCYSTRSLLSQIIYSCKTFYMFRTVVSPIIRSSKLRIQQRYVSNSCCCMCSLELLMMNGKTEICRTFYKNK